MNLVEDSLSVRPISDEVLVDSDLFVSCCPREAFPGMPQRAQNTVAPKKKFSPRMQTNGGFFLRVGLRNTSYVGAITDRHGAIS